MKTTMTNKTTVTVTDEQIEALRSEAVEHGDLVQVAICDLAIAGDESAQRKCSDVIEDVFNQD